MIDDHPPVGSVWTDNDNDPSFAYTILILGNNIQGNTGMSRVLVIYNDGIIRDALWSTRSFDSAQDMYTLIYSPEEREERGET